VEIEVWRIDLRADADVALLSGDERARARRYASEPAARRWRAARAGLRTLLGRRLAVDPAAIAFAAGPDGKPYVSSAPLRFNLSHAGDVALVALAPAHEVGVDVERLDRRSGAVERALSAGERAALASAGGALRHRALLQLWCRKEALAKARGSGLGWAPERVDTLAAGDAALVDLDVGAGYVAALAVLGADAPLRARLRELR